MLDMWALFGDALQSCAMTYKSFMIRILVVLNNISTQVLVKQHPIISNEQFPFNLPY